MGFFELILKVLSSDLIQRAGSNACTSNAKFLRLGDNFFVLQAELLRNFVNANGHISLTLHALIAPERS
jgi:hypothetical protein